MKPDKILTFEQHQELGKMLKKIRDNLGTFTCLIDSAKITNRGHGRQGRYLANIFNKTQGLVDGLRSELEEDLFSNFRDKADIKIYYPGEGK